jgi:hypothetical protein
MGIGGDNSLRLFGGIHHRQKNLSKFSEFFHLAYEKLENENCSNASFFARADLQPIRSQKKKAP